MSLAEAERRIKADKYEAFSKGLSGIQAGIIQQLNVRRTNQTQQSKVETPLATQEKTMFEGITSAVTKHMNPKRRLARKKERIETQLERYGELIGNKDGEGGALILQSVGWGALAGITKTLWNFGPVGKVAPSLGFRGGADCLRGAPIP